VNDHARTIGGINRDQIGCELTRSARAKLSTAHIGERHAGGLVPILRDDISQQPSRKFRRLRAIVNKGLQQLLRRIAEWECQQDRN